MPVYKLKDRKGWYFSFTYNGKRYKKENYKGMRMETKTQAQACENDYRQFLINEDNKKSLDIKEKTSLAEAFLAFTESKKITLKASTSSRLMTFYKNDLPCKDKLLSEITISDIDTWKTNLKNNDNIAVVKNRKLGMMDSFLEWCNIHYDLTNKLRIPLESKFIDDREPTQANIYTLEQFLLFDSVIDNSFYKTLFNVLFFTGLRIGELTALQVTDYKDNSFIINKGYIRINNKDIIQTPKTKNSYRSIALDDDTSKMVKDLIGNRNKGFIFGDDKPISQQQIRRVNAQYAKAAGLTQLKIHEFRKSHATYLKDLGFDAYAIAARLGNTPEMSNEVYIRAHNDDQLKIVRTISVHKK